MVTLQHLEMIAAIHRAGGFRGAARELKITQPTLSKAIIRLETQLGYKLFERTPTGARSTPAAAYIAKGAEPLLQGAARLMAEAKRRQDGEEGRLRLGVGSMLKHLFLPRLMRHIRGRFPNIQCTLTQSGADDLIKQIVAGKLDVAFVYHEVAMEHEDLVRSKIFGDYIAIIARPGHPLDGVGPVSQHDLHGFAFGLPGIRSQVMEWLEFPAEARDESGVALQSDNYDVLLDEVQQSDCLTMAPATFFRELIEDGKIVMIPTAKDPLPYECWMLSGTEFARTILFSALADMAREAYREAHS